ncbi:MAG: bifunctional folylpolyglutamate synthase/dihydrofolate synthase, partial [Candidatus Omnitrophica bacterium]|nr:bifunctional folylpolyglutamate synthase/dihydrofolate synthase [Candidatus Omnitrophota bacterium]
MIKKEELCSLAEKIKPVISKIGKGSDLYPTFFEVYTAIAFLYFKEKKTDFCVLEVGMGGRLDATNIIERPFASGITQISYDHTQKLGNTL